MLSEDGHALGIVYQHVARVDAEGNVVETWSQGELTREIEARAARPWLFPRELALSSHGFNLPDPASTDRFKGFQIVTNGTEIDPPPVASDELEIDPRLAAALAAAGGDEPIKASFFLRDYPRWSIPTVPAPRTLSAEDQVAILEERGDGGVGRRRRPYGRSG